MTIASLWALCALLLLTDASTALAVGPPVVEDESALDVSGTSATLQAAINPEGGQTTYHFEYGSSEAYGSTIPIPDALAGSGTSGAIVSVHVQGLASETGYHYRVVASSGAGTAYGTDHIFTTQGVGGELKLLDGRQWEMVSPPNKQGASIEPIAEGLVQAASDGHAITYLTTAPTESEPQGNGAGLQQIFSSRGTREWSSKDISTPHSAATTKPIGKGYEYRFFSPDLSLAVVEPFGPFTSLSPDATEKTEYVRRNGECETSIATCYTPLVDAANLPPGTKTSGSEFFAGATADLSHVVLNSSSVGLTATPGDEGGLYEWVAGQLRLVSVLPESEGGTSVKFAALGYKPSADDARNAISRDGSRIFWSPTSGIPQLYMRDVDREETVRIGSGEAHFQTANQDGSRVFFSSGSEGPLEVCDIVEVGGKLACELSQLAPSVLGAVPGASEDGSYVYFVSNAQLASGAVAGTCEPFAQSNTASDLCNLYVVHDDGIGWESPKLIGVLSGLDSPDWSTGEFNLSRLTARVTGSGRWLAFMSQRDLTGYDTTDVLEGSADEEVYLYDASNERLACASCDPTGGRPIGTRYNGGVYYGFLGGGDIVWPHDAMLAANIPGWTRFELTTALYQSRYLSEDGRLFFNSGDALVPQDVNGTWDVYEYEPPGVGTCSAASTTFSAQADGCVDLVSSGDSPEQSAFMDASESGDDVFFLVANHLAAQDFDTSYDIYDAHVCSANVPCVSSSVLPPPCATGDSCKSAPSPQPSVFGAPPSATFAGIGNVAGTSGETVRHRSLTRAQKLHRALRACHRKRSRHRRVACERRARKRYSAKKAMRGSR